MTANSSLSGPRGLGTIVEQSAVMASSGPGAKAPRPFPTATSPCTGSPTSLFRQFAPESSLPSPGFVIYPPNRPQNGNGKVIIHSMAINDVILLEYWPQNEWGIRHFHSMARRRKIKPASAGRAGGTRGFRGMCPRGKKAAGPPTLRARRQGCESPHRAEA